jgi:hypothetical protein
MLRWITQRSVPWRMLCSKSVCAQCQIRRCKPLTGRLSAVVVEVARARALVQTTEQLIDMGANSHASTGAGPITEAPPTPISSPPPLSSCGCPILRPMSASCPARRWNEAVSSIAMRGEATA